MKVLVLLAFAAIGCHEASGEKTEFHFLRIEKMNETDDLFKYDLQKVQKSGDLKFIVNCESDLFVDLDNEWHVSTVNSSRQL